ncbi:MAG: hypothetical protein ABR584_08855 [Candidatus Baltobacteraceae bacterium]
MTAEWLTAIGTLGTFGVIAASAAAALIQLRHLRSSNQIATITQLRQYAATPEFKNAQRLVLTQLNEKMEDPEFRYQMAHPEARDAQTGEFIQDLIMYADYYETMGSLVKNGLLDKRMAIDLFGFQITSAWRRLAFGTAILRREVGSVLGENLEYLVVLAQDDVRAHPKGTYPRGVRRVELPDIYLDADEKYEAIRDGLCENHENLKHSKL